MLSQLRSVQLKRTSLTASCSGAFHVFAPASGCLALWGRGASSAVLPAALPFLEELPEPLRPEEAFSSAGAARRLISSNLRSYFVAVFTAAAVSR